MSAPSEVEVDEPDGWFGRERENTMHRHPSLVLLVAGIACLVPACTADAPPECPDHTDEVSSCPMDARCFELTGGDETVTCRIRSRRGAADADSDGEVASAPEDTTVDSADDTSPTEETATDDAGEQDTAAETPDGADAEGDESCIGPECDPDHIKFSSSFSNVRICDTEGECASEPPIENSYYECHDESVYLTGTDSETGYQWPVQSEASGDLPGNGSRNYFNDVIDGDGNDCCPTCDVTHKRDCHRFRIEEATQHDGTPGNVLTYQTLKDCSSQSYSRLQYNMFEADSPTDKGWKDFSAFYYEVWMRFPNLDEKLEGGALYAALAELYMRSAWKLTIVLSTRDSPTGEPIFQMKNKENNRVGHWDNAISPENNQWFKLRVWYRAGREDGHWKATYTCPDCSPSVPETVIKEWRGPTQDPGEDPFVISPLKFAFGWGLKMQIDDLRYGAHPEEL